MIEQMYIPPPARPGFCFKGGDWKKNEKGLFEASCKDTSECYGCGGTFQLSFDPSRIINFDEIRAPSDEDYVNLGSIIVTSEDFDKRALKKYVESKETWYYFHALICDEDRICVYQLAKGEMA